MYYYILTNYDILNEEETQSEMGCGGEKSSIKSE